MRWILSAAVALLFVPTGLAALWTVRTHEDEFTGDVAHYAVAYGTGGTYQGFGEAPHVGLQCDKRGAVFYFETHSNFLDSGGDIISGMVKVDARPTRRIRFTAGSEGTGGRVIASRTGDGFWDLINDMRAGYTLKLRVHDFRGVSYDYEFPLDGVTRATNALDCFRRGRAAQAAEEAAEREAAERRESREREYRNRSGYPELEGLSAGDAAEIDQRVRGIDAGDTIDVASCELGTRARLRAAPEVSASGSEIPRSDVCSFGSPSAEVLEIRGEGARAWFRIRLEGGEEGWVPARYIRPD